MPSHIRNFVIIAHVDHGKSTLADRMLELTGTVDARRMKPQYLDQLELERERGITIKMAPVRMVYHARGLTQTDTRTDADEDLLYKDLTYNIRGTVFEVRKNLGLGHKESVYHNALIQEFKKRGISFETEKHIGIFYEGAKVGSYQPDFVIDEKIIVELKALPEIGRPQTEQLWSYLKGSSYKLALLINFGGKDVEIKRVVYDNVRVLRESASSQRQSAQVEYQFNLIDTPGHSDFQYEVSRALHAVEGAVLLVDVTKGIQAQTLANYRNAVKAGLTIIGAVNKVDLPTANTEPVAKALAELIGAQPEDIFRISGRTGLGVPELLEAIAKRVPEPKVSVVEKECDGQALIFDSLYNDHKGILAYVRVFSGAFRPGDEVSLVAGGTKFKIKEVGYFAPQHTPTDVLRAGGTGYIATGFKEPALVKIGDTMVAYGISHMARGAGNKQYAISHGLALPGYREATPVVFISFYPDGATKFDDLKRGFERLQLTDAALSFEPDSNEALGRGLKAGFLGQLHFEITASRLTREFNSAFITSFPSIAYRVREKGVERIVKDAHEFPASPDEVFQPMIKMEILFPAEYMSAVMGLKNKFDIEIQTIQTIGDNSVVEARMPLSELIRDFDDQLKSSSAGYASFSYELDGEEKADVKKLEILVVEEVVPALTRIVAKKDVEYEARRTVERLKELLEKQQFSQAIQARADGRILARETIPAMKKALGDFGKNGGDRTRKMKLWKKQERGKERLESSARARVNLPVEVFREILKK
jgi:GTP-binding protein LepA